MNEAGGRIATRLWRLYEPYHAAVYFAPDAKETFAAVGLRGWWMGYFASRAAPMGPVPADVVIATFYNFHPSMVRRAIPDAWRFSTPDAVIDARVALADRALRRLLDDLVGTEDIARAADLARAAAEACDPVGRALFAGHASLPWPREPHLVLWHAATLLREFRGDGHVAALVAHEVDGCESHVLMAADGRVSPELQRQARAWSLEDWGAAEERLRKRGLLDDGGVLTTEGRQLRASVEAMTDRLATPPVTALGAARAEELERLMRAPVEGILDGGGVPFPNPIGLTR